jgi:hypothetical protein
MNNDDKDMLRRNYERFAKECAKQVAGAVMDLAVSKEAKESRNPREIAELMVKAAHDAFLKAVHDQIGTIPEKEKDRLLELVLIQEVGPSIRQSTRRLVAQILFDGKVSMCFEDAGLVIIPDAP